MATLTHPAWCQPDLCTAKPSDAVSEGYVAGEAGSHRSGAVTVPLAGALHAAVGPVAFMASLTRVAAPGPVVTYLRLTLDTPQFRVPVETAEPAFEELLALTRTGMNAEEETR